MPNNYLSVLYHHIIQVENKNVGLKVEGHKHTIAPPVKKVGGGTCPPCPPASYASVYIYIYIYIYIYQWRSNVPKSVGGGGAHRHVIFVSSVKNQYKRVVFGCMVIK